MATGKKPKLETKDVLPQEVEAAIDDLQDVQIQLEKVATTREDPKLLNCAPIDMVVSRAHTLPHNIYDAHGRLLVNIFGALGTLEASRSLEDSCAGVCEAGRLYPANGRLWPADSGLYQRPL